MTQRELEGILKNVSCGAYKFKVIDYNNQFFLQVSFLGTCSETGKEEEQKGRKWYVSQFSTRSEVVQTAFKAVMTHMEHEIREHFKYRDKAIFGPHYNVDLLWEICGSGGYDVR